MIKYKKIGKFKLGNEIKYAYQIYSEESEEEKQIRLEKERIQEEKLDESWNEIKNLIKNMEDILKKNDKL